MGINKLNDWTLTKLWYMEHNQHHIWQTKGNGPALLSYHRTKITLQISVGHKLKNMECVRAKNMLQKHVSLHSPLLWSVVESTNKNYTLLSLLYSFAFIYYLHNPTNFRKLRCGIYVEVEWKDVTLLDVDQSFIVRLAQAKNKTLFRIRVTYYHTLDDKSAVTTSQLCTQIVFPWYYICSNKIFAVFAGTLPCFSFSLKQIKEQKYEFMVAP